MENNIALGFASLIHPGDRQIMATGTHNTFFLCTIMLHLLHQISPLTLTAIQSLEPDCELRLGDQSAEVQDLQLILKELGFYHGALDSEFQPETERALLHLQQQLGVQATGQLDIETWYAITYWAEEKIIAQSIAA
jgi:hypothetical protein